MILMNNKMRTQTVHMYYIHVLSFMDDYVQTLEYVC